MHKDVTKIEKISHLIIKNTYNSKRKAFKEILQNLENKIHFETLFTVFEPNCHSNKIYEPTFTIRIIDLQPNLKDIQVRFILKFRTRFQGNAHDTALARDVMEEYS
jgi:hypothetical protein